MACLSIKPSCDNSSLPKCELVAMHLYDHGVVFVLNFPYTIHYTTNYDFNVVLDKGEMRAIKFIKTLETIVGKIFDNNLVDWVKGDLDETEPKYWILDELAREGIRAKKLTSSSKLIFVKLYIPLCSNPRGIILEHNFWEQLDLKPMGHF